MNGEAYRGWISEHIAIGKEILYLTQEDVRKTPVSPLQVLELTEKALTAYSAGKVDMPAKIGIHPFPDTFYHAMPAYVPDICTAGIKWGSCYPKNQRLYGYSQANGLIILNDHLSGAPIAILDCIYVTEIRTAAVTYASAKYLSNTGTETFGMIGCGVEGRQHVKNITLALPNLKKIYVYDILDEAAEALIRDLQPVVSTKIIKAASFEEISKSVETLVSATVINGTPEPDIRDEWISKGQTILLCDAHSRFEHGIMLRADKYIVDSVEQHELLKGYGYYPHGLPEIYAETGEITGGVKAGRVSPDELIVCNNIGMAVEDMYVVRALFDKALEDEIGRKLPL